LIELRNIFLTALVILCSCSSNDAPEDLISKKKMVKILVEVHVLESKVKNVDIDPDDSVQQVYDHFEGLLFEDLEITQDQYERSFNYYVDNPSDLEEIYETVIDSLLARENRYK